METSHATIASSLQPKDCLSGAENKTRMKTEKSDVSTLTMPKGPYNIERIGRELESSRRQRTNSKIWNLKHKPHTPRQRSDSQPILSLFGRKRHAQSTILLNSEAERKKTQVLSPSVPFNEKNAPPFMQSNYLIPESPLHKSPCRYENYEGTECLTLEEKIERVLGAYE